MQELQQFNFYGYRLSGPWDLSWLQSWQESEIASGEVALLDILAAEK
jgi:hypothetical protein